MPKNSLPPFLEKLQAITETIQPAIANWSDDGKTYRVHKADEFEVVLRQYFKGNVQTFVRQLHFYGFRKLDSQTGSWAFAHKHFVKGNPELLHEIRRKTRSDPTADGAASKDEVQVLRTQVAFLQDIAEDLRTQLDTVINVLDEAGVAEVDRRAHDGKPLLIKPGNKRGISELNKSSKIEETAAFPYEVDPLVFESDSDIDSASLGGLSSSDMSIVDEVLGDESDDDASSVSVSDLLINQNIETDCRDVIQSISKVTMLDQDSVSKVIGYFRKLSTTAEPYTYEAPIPVAPRTPTATGVSCGKSDPLNDPLPDLMHLPFEQLNEAPLPFKKPAYLQPLQKVR